MRCATYLILPLLVVGLSALAQSNAPDGLLLNDSAYEQLPSKAPVQETRKLRLLPTAVSYEAFCPPPIHQGNLGTCSSIVLGYYIRTIMEATQRRLKRQPNIQTSFSPSYIYQVARSKNDFQCTNGLELSAALDVLRQKGIVSFSRMGYPACDVNPEQLGTEALQNRIADAHQILDLQEPESKRIDRLKSALAEGEPVIISFFAFDTFKKLTTNLWAPSANDEATLRKRLTEYRAGNKVRAHALCLLGYDNNRFGGAFRVVNSYGTAWGDKGFAWIRYADLAHYTRYAAQLYPRLTDTDALPLLGLTVDMGFYQTNGAVMPVRYSAADAKRVGFPVYRLVQTYPGETAFKIQLSNSQQTYLQVYGTDEVPTTTPLLLYPFTETRAGRTTIYSPRLGARAASMFPPNNAIELDRTPGIDYLLLLFSEQPVARDLLEKQLQQTTGPLLARFGALATLKGVARHKAEANQLSIGVISSGSVLPVLVLIEHR